MEVEVQNLYKLRRLEKELTKLLEKIDNEIIQTDMEWLNFRAIAGKTTKQQEVTQNASTNKDLNQIVTSIDDDRLNDIRMDLTLMKERLSDEEEFDSD